MGNSGTCSRPVIKKEKPVETSVENTIVEKKGDDQSMIKVGKPAPKFEAPAFYKGNFTNISLDDFKGKWVLLCFYPGDFTFV